MERILECDIQPLSCVYNQPGRVEIWKVKEIRTSRILCMKKIFINSINEATDIQRECLAMATLYHENIVSIIAASIGGKDKEISHIIIFTEFYEEGDLQMLIQKRISQRNYFTENQITMYFNQLLKAFVFMQEREIAHRDVKPQNIFVSDNGQNLKLADLGSAKKKNSGINDFTGTPLYLSPKLRDIFQKGTHGFGTDDNSFKSDVYSLGLTFLYMASLKDLNDLTDLKTLANKISIRLNEIESSYPTFTRFLRLMLKVSESERPDFFDLKKLVTEESSTGFNSINSFVKYTYYKIQPLDTKCSVCGNVKRDEEQYFYNAGIVCFDCFKEFQKSHENRPLYHVKENKLHYVNSNYICECKIKFCAICKFAHDVNDICFDAIKNTTHSYYLSFSCPECQEHVYSQDRHSLYFRCNNYHFFCSVCLRSFNESIHTVCKKVMTGFH